MSTFTLDEIRIIPTTVKTIAGDVNSDGSINLFDAVSALQTVAGSPTKGAKAADVNGDNKIGIAEAVYILNVIK